MTKQYKIDTSLARMDSLMISSNAKRLSRLELAFRVIKNAVKLLAEKQPLLLDDTLKEFQKEDFEKEILYRTTSNNSKERLNTLVSIAYKLNEQILKISELENFNPVQILSRFVDEQCVINADGEILPKDSKLLHSKMLQTPTDPEATYRKKGEDKHVGYVGNVLEVRDKEKKIGIILDFDLKQNIYSDVTFAKDTLENNDVIKEIDQLCVDGGYYGGEVVIEANKKDIAINFSAMTGKVPETDKINAHEYKFNGETCKCPADKTSFSVKTNEDNNSWSAYFYKSDCNKCPLKDKCYQKDGTDYSIVHLTLNQQLAAETRAKIGTKEHTKLANYRAGVEGVPSVLRRKYRVDKIPVYGLLRKKLWFSTKIMAKNIKAFTKYRVVSSMLSIKRFYKQIKSSLVPIIYHYSV